MPDAPVKVGAAPDGVARTLRDALIAELLGDVRILLDRTTQLQADLSATSSMTQQSADALRLANAEMRSGTDQRLLQFRQELALMLSRSTEMALASNVTALQSAAVTALRQAIASEDSSRRRRQQTVIAGLALAGGFAGAVLAQILGSWLR